MAKQHTNPIIHVSHVNMSETLAPYHLHIRSHILRLAEELETVTRWEAASAEHVADKAAHTRTGSYSPLTIFAAQDTVSLPNAFNMITEKQPFIIAEQSDDIRWTYTIYHADLLNVQRNFKTAKVRVNEGRITVEDDFYGFKLVPTPAK